MDIYLQSCLQLPAAAGLNLPANCFDNPAESAGKRTIPAEKGALVWSVFNIGGQTYRYEVISATYIDLISRFNLTLQIQNLDQTPFWAKQIIQTSTKKLLNYYFNFYSSLQPYL
ncbi:Hypothetical_protein [Hexamita inflata]|uniref:Hypothetical_protein n=1 Tax=Hexamita inflata TaxID=28002 RepID=A0ABP1HGK1_9EUKA